MKNVFSAAIIINIAAATTFGWLRFSAATLAPVELAGRYGQLDRAGVIDQERLAVAFPRLSENSRVAVPHWLGGSLVESNQNSALGGLGLAGINLVLLAVIRRGRVVEK